MSLSKSVDFKNSKGETVTLNIKSPSAKDWREAKSYSVKIASEMFRQKNKDGTAAFLVRANMKEHLIDAGLWTEDDDKELVDIAIKVRELEQKLSQGGISKRRGRDICIELSDLRSNYIEKTLKLHSFDNLTIEYQQSQAEMDYLCSTCILDESGSPLFSSTDDFMERLNDEAYYIEARDELQKLIYGDETIDDIMAERPEVKFLKHFKYVNDNLQYINEDGVRVNKAGEVIEESPTTIEFIEEFDYSKFTDE